MSLCGHTSVMALFRFELQNNFSIPVELHITYLLPTLVERTSLHATIGGKIGGCRGLKLVVYKI